ncbi:hypothetical protein KC19_4G081700 [Ceratodon purpureus]|uniref:Uncharacterized protein n=1 Tax=Ceratodon purpureus TaxID=3225 RepID=A0A8T0I7Z6_CERPU|nr:hypothetical protein KC19_4G081700 [Ceratodon purpureus]
MHCFRARRRASSFRISNGHPVLEMKLAPPEIDIEILSVKQPQLNEEVEQARALNSVRLLQESILCPDDEEEYSPTGRLSVHRRMSTPFDYTLAIDYTASKVISAVIDKCKLLQCVTSLFKEESHELLSTLEGLFVTLQTIAGSPHLGRFQNVLEEIMLYSTKAYAFLEKLCCMTLPNSSHGLHKAAAKMSEFACRFYNHTVGLTEPIEQCWDDGLNCEKSSREKRLSFGVTTYTVPILDVKERLLKKKRVLIPLLDLEGNSEYNVELAYPRASRWFSRDATLSARIESHERGFSQILQADRVKMEKGSWGWEEAQETVLLTYEDLVVANMASVTGSLLTYNKQYSSIQSSPPKLFNTQKYRTSIQIVGASRIDLDLQDLFIKGVKSKDHVYYKCFVNTERRGEVLAIYRFQHKQFHKGEGLLHIVGRGNQPGLRHVLVSIFASLGFTPSA